MKKIFTLICCLTFLALGRADAQNAPISTIGTIYSAGTTAVVPITMNNFTNIYSINLKVVYSPGVATMTNVTLGSGISGQLSFNILKLNPNDPDTMTLGWFASSPTTLPAGTTVFNMHFNKVANGTANIFFVDDNNSFSCRFRDGNFTALNDTPTSTYYLPGSLTFVTPGNAPVSKIGSAQGCAGSQITVPVTVDGFYQVGAASLMINYNPAQLSNPIVDASASPFTLTSSTSTPGVITISGSSTAPAGHTLPYGSTFFTLTFTYLGGNAPLNFNISAPGNCDYGGPTPLYAHLNDTPESSFFLGGTITCSTTAPVITQCPPSQVLPMGPNCQSALPNYTSLASGTATCPPLTFSQVPAPGTLVSGGSNTTVVLTATDACGNTSTCSFIVTTADNTAPTAICANPTIYLNVAGQATLSPAQVDNGSFDDCSIAGFSLSKTSFDCSNVGANFVVMTVTDASGNSSTCTSVVTVSETILPTALCQNLSIYLDANGQAQITPAQINNGSFDNCSLKTVSLNQTLFTCAHLGVNTVVLTAEDMSGNTSTCTATVTVGDQTAPQITCPSSPQLRNVTAPISSYDAQGQEFDLVTITDNCGLPIQLSNNLDGQNTLDSYSFPLGSTTVIWTATDTYQNSSSCSFVVTVNQVNTPPTLQCPQNLVVNTDQGICSTSVSSGLNAVPIDPDNNIIALSWVMTGATTASSPLSGINQIGSFTFVRGITTVSYLVTDAGNATATCSFTVEVVDVEAPQALCQSLNLALDGSGQVIILPSQVDNGSTDNCSIASFQLSKSVFTCADLGVNTVVLTVADQSGNTSTCTASVTITDDQIPSAICKDITLNLDAQGQATLTPSLIDNGSSDNCGFTLTAQPNTFNCSNLGANTVLLTVTDAAGNSATCSAIVTIADNSGPAMTCPGNPQQRYILLSTSNYTAQSSEFDPSAPTDNCGGSILLSNNLNGLGSLAGYVFPVGSTTVVWTATDANQNSSTCSFIVEVIYLNDPPSVTCPQTILANTDQGLCTALITTGLSASITDPDNNANRLTWTMTGATTDASPTTGINNLTSYTFNRGTTTIQYIVYDDFNLSDTCDFTVVVTDNQAPLALCQNLNINLDQNGVASISASQVDNGSTDNCGIQSLALNRTLFGCGDIASNPNTVVLTVTDVAGNTATCTATVTVTDDLAPIANCQNITLPLDAQGNAILTAAAVNNGSTDNCGIQNLSISRTAFSCADIAANPTTVVLTVTDVNGNSSTCSALVTVADTTDPVASCSNATVYLDASGQATLSAAQVNNNSSDNCGIASVTVNPSSFTCAQLGTNTVVLTASDVNGNTSSCTATVTVSDAIAPVLVCPSPLSLNCASQLPAPATTLSQFLALPGAQASDNCPVGLQLSHVGDVTGNQTCPNSFTITRTYLLSDASGNSVTCSYIISVSDQIAPNVYCPYPSAGNIVVNPMAGANYYPVNADEFDPDSLNDNCSGTLALTNNLNGQSTLSGYHLPGGLTTIIWTATDACGNTATCSFNIYVNQYPNITCQQSQTLPAEQGMCSANVTGLAPISFSDPDNNLMSLTWTVSGATSAASPTTGVNVLTNLAFNTGISTVTYVATDSLGLFTSCSFTVVIEDTQAPLALCKNITLPLNGQGLATLTASLVDNGSTDNCGVTSMSVSPSTFNCTQIGANSVVLTLSDAAGNTATCSATVTIVDQTAPFALCSNINVSLDANGNASITPAQVDGGSYDNCGSVTLSVSPSSFTCANLGANTVILTVSDASGHSSTCSATVTVSDPIYPQAACKPATLSLDAQGNALLLPSLIDNGSTDNCPGSMLLSVSPSTFTCANLGPNTVVLTVTDAAGNSTTCTTIVTIIDDLPPQASCLSINLPLDVQGNATITVAMIDNNSSDNCGITNRILSQSQFNCSHIGPNTVTLTLSDASGNTSSCTAVVTVLDNIPPVAICQNLTVPLDASGSATISASQINNGSYDNCGIATISVSPSTFTCSEAGTNTVVLTVTDLSGNSSTCTATITVVDNLAPQAICQNVTVYLDAQGQASLTPAQVNNGSSDNCGITLTQLSQSSFNCSNMGLNTVTLSVSDAAGNISTCSAVITVADTIAPVAICQNLTLYLNSSGSAAIIPAMINNGSYDNCQINSITVSPSVLDCSNLGTNTVTMTITDLAGNSSTCTSVVTLFDTISPIAICKNISISLDGQGNAGITASQIDNGSSDNCSIATMSVSPSQFTCSNLGPNTVILTVTDASGTVSTCSSVVTIVDDTPPSALCQNVTIILDAFGQASVTAAQVNNGSSDNCSQLSFNLSQSAFTCAHLGTNSVILTVTDGSGNSATCLSTITVLDNTPPQALCQAATVFLGSNGTISITPQIIDNGSNDNCAVTLMTVSPSSFDCSNLGSNTVTLTVSDQSGNSSTCTAQLTVLDNTSPTVQCPPAINVACASLVPAPVITLSGFNLLGGSYSDNCQQLTITHVGDQQSTPICPNQFTITRTYLITDASGNTASCTQTITVNDQTAPLIQCPADPQVKTVIAPATTYLTSGAEFDPIASSDNCSGSVTLSNNLNGTPSLAGFSFPLGQTQVVWTATDNCGNTSTCAFSVIISQGNQPPQISCPQNLSINTDPGSCTALVSSLAPASYSDPDNNIVSLTWTISGATTASSPLTGINVIQNTAFALGTSTILYTVTDGGGLFASCSFTLTVVDAEAPSAVCQAGTLSLDGNGNATLLPQQIDAGSIDNCGNVNLSVSPSLFTCANLGANTVVLTVSDAAGNTSTCTAIVTVVDPIGPQALCKNTSLSLDANGVATLLANQMDNGSSDNCGVTSLVVTPSQFNCSHLGLNTVTLTVSDAAGNTATCTAQVTITDPVPPVAICQNATIFLDANGQAALSPNQVDNASFDNCGPVSLSVSPSSFNCSNLGANTVVLTVSDGSGNTSSCTAIVSVLDNIAPVALCQGLTLQLDNQGQAVLQAGQIDNGSSDNCGVSTMTVTPSLFDCSMIGLNTVVLTVNDMSGNSSSCTAIVTVIDNIAPVANCKNAQVYLNAQGQVTFQAGLIDNGSTDNCQIASVVVSPSSFSCSNLGANTVLMTVTDASGNSSTCISTVMVLDTIAPVAICRNATISLDASGQALLQASNVDNASFDNCGIISISVSPSSFSCANLGTNTVVLTVIDGSGNSSTCAALVTVVDDTPPQAQCQNASITLNASGTAVLSASQVDNGSFDNCAVSNHSVSPSTFTCANVGVNTVILTVSDASGNSSTCSASVTVIDGIAPTALCKNVTLPLDAQGQATLSAAMVDNGSFDNCAINSMSVSPSTFTCADLGTHTVVLTLSDASGNSSTCAALVTVVDQIAPQALCQNLSINLNSNGTASITASQVNNGSTDNCSLSTLSINPSTFTCANLGPNTVTLTVSDQSGNISTCTAVVTVLDTIAPVAQCSTATISLSAQGSVVLTAQQINNGSSDNCGITSMMLSQGTFTCANIGQNMVVLTVSDASGNSAACMTVVNVIDPIPPLAICQNAALVLDATGIASLTSSMINNGSSDNCGISSITVSPSVFNCANLGLNTVIMTVTDLGGNSSTCTATVTVSDLLAPQANCKNITLPLDAQGLATLGASMLDNGSSDNCGIVSYSVNPSAFDCTNLGPNTVVLIVSDAAGNTSSCTAIVNVVDQTAPVALCQNQTISLDANGIATLSTSQLNNGSYDNCGISSITASQLAFNCSNLGLNTVILTVSDGSGNTSTCSAQVTVLDNIAPMASCQNATIYLDAAGSATLSPTQINNGSSDNCSLTGFSVAPSAFTCADLGVNTVVLTVSDQSGNTATCSALVTVLDNIAPIVQCQPVTLALDASGSAVLNASQVNNGSTDNCGVTGITVTPANFTCANLGANTVVLTVSDQSGNTSTCTATVTVIDDIAPTAICQNVTLNLSANGTATLTAAQVNNGSTDNCTVSNLSISPSSFTCTNIGANTVILTVSDQSGNSSSCTAVVTVVDNIPPTASCQPVTIFLNASGIATVTAAQVNANSSDNCTVSNLSISPSSFTCANIGANTVILTVSDQSGNSSTCSAVVTVVDNIPPVASCQPVTIYLSAAGTATITAAQVNANSSDNCTVSNLSVTPSSFTCANLGANTVILTVSDQSGNTSTCTATVTVIDNIAPTAICQNVTLNLSANGTATLTAAQVNNGSTDNCTLSNLSVTPSIFTCANLGTNTVVLTVSDQSGNTGTCTAIVTVVDNIPPTASCQNVTLALNSSGVATLTAAQINNGSSDNCTVANVSVSPSTFTCANLGANTVTLLVSDQSGNSSTCTALVTIVDNILPLASCQPVTIFLGANGTATLNAAQVNNGSSDNCGITSLSVTPSNFTCSNLGANTVILTVSDQSGNTSTCTAIVTVVDNIPPTAICQNITLPLNAAGSASLSTGMVNNGSSDNCSIASVNVSPFLFNCTNLGANTVTLTVTDQSGNSATCTAIVTVVDNIPPTAQCQNLTLPLGAGGTATLAASLVNNGSTDNCGIVNMSVSPSTFNCNNLGANTVVFTVADQSGNTSTCTATVTVVDNTAPSALCQNITLPLSAAGTATLTASMVNNGSTDNCSIASMTVTPSAFTCANLGANTVTLTVTDISGNSSSCTAIVTVLDNILPTVFCQGLTLALGANGTASITAAQINNGSFDNCAIAGMNVSPFTFNCSNLGTNTVTLTVTDGSGNSASCTASVTILDSIYPSALCKSITVPLDANGLASITASQVDNGSSDNCSITTMQLSQTSFTCANLGVNFVTLTVTDQSGNSSSCTANVTIVDNMPPTASCKNFAVGVNPQMGSVTVLADSVNNGSKDNCSVVSMVLVPNTFTMSNLGPNVVVLTLTDQSGNSSTCTATVTVVNNTALPEEIDPENRLKLSIYPNPASGEVSIKTDGLDEKGYIQVSNLLGQVLITLPADNEELRLDISQLPSGIYNVRLISGRAETVTRLVVAGR
jgi:hypothetical protein